MGTDMQQLDPDLARGLDALVESVARIVREQRRCCPTCINFDQRTEGCNLANKQRPPANVIAFGCKAWEHDIPF